MVGRSQLQTRRVHMSLLGLSVEGLESLAVKRITPYTRAFPNSCHGSSLRSKRTEEWPRVASISQLHQSSEFHRNHPRLLGFLCLAVKQKRDQLPPLRPLALKIARSHHCPSPAMVLDLSSPPLTLHNLPFVEGGGWENQTPQIVSHSMWNLVSGREACSPMGSPKMLFKA